MQENILIYVANCIYIEIVAETMLKLRGISFTFYSEQPRFSALGLYVPSQNLTSPPIDLLYRRRSHVSSMRDKRALLAFVCQSYIANTRAA